MPRRKNKRAKKKEVSIGEMYQNIVVPRDVFWQEKEEILKKRANPGYVRLCKRIYQMVPSLGSEEPFKDEYRNAIDLLGWDLKPKEFSAAVRFIFLITILASFIIWLIMINGPPAKILRTVPFGLYMPLFALVTVSLLITRYVQQYPLTAVNVEIKKSLAYIPEIIGYFIMSLKLTPNLEQATEFAASHGRGQIAQDFKKMLWELELGIHATITEGLDSIAYRWGRYAPEFKRALMRIRASILEESEAKREVLLNRTMDELLASIREKMENYAHALIQPSIALFYIGILLPVILIVILPVGSIFTGMPWSNPIALIAIYNIALPLTALYFARGIIKTRPPVYEAPEIPDDYPGLPPKGKIKTKTGTVDIKTTVAIIAILGLVCSYYFHLEGFPPKSMLLAISESEEIVQIIPADKTEEEVLQMNGYPPRYFDIPDGTYYKMVVRSLRASGYTGEELRKKAEQEVRLARLTFFMSYGNDITPYNLWFGILLTISACMFVWLYYNSIYKRKMQQKVIGMEYEFKDAIYIIASRLGENKPMEEAIKHAVEFLPNYTISKEVFSKALDNINILGMPLYSAFFDHRFGAAERQPSNIIKTGLRLALDAVALGVNIAARSLISFALQLENSERVAKLLKSLVKDITTMMMTMGVIITPVVLGITTTLYKIVVQTAIKVVESGVFEKVRSQTLITRSMPGPFTRANILDWIKVDAITQIAEPLLFILIVGIYVMEIVLIIIYFATKLEEDNNLLVKVNIAKYLPVALIIYVITVMFSNTLIGAYM
ncbi:MAG: hypothetical protein J7J87_00045 [Candidatus Diapherotrites archaeon]|nr:hypothetical protein [Candidatus Diapherotrites archaeon]